MRSRRRLHVRAMATVGISLWSAAAFVFCPDNSSQHHNQHRTLLLKQQQQQQQFQKGQTGCENYMLRSNKSTSKTMVHLASSSSSDSCDGETWRLKKTKADEYFAKHGTIPEPHVLHAVLPAVAGKKVLSSDGTRSYQPHKILVIGDIHGCFDELQALHQKAVIEHNDGIPFDYVILVGDLCNKGPDSGKVIKWARTTPNVRSVRGNHEVGALSAALGDARRRELEKYRWIVEGEVWQQMYLQAGFQTNKDPGRFLSDADVEWLAELPYTLTIPGLLLNEKDDTVIVHAGLIPGKPLELQELSTMVTVRDLFVKCDENSRFLCFDPRSRSGKKVSLPPNSFCDVSLPWAYLWRGPQRVIFGHDAKRGLQRYSGDFAIGLDTGACYGRQLTGIVLPEKTIVSVESKQQQ